MCLPDILRALLRVLLPLPTVFPTVSSTNRARVVIRRFLRTDQVFRFDNIKIGINW